MSYQGTERRRSNADEVEGLVQRVVREGVPVDELESRETDAAKGDELRAAVKEKLLSLAGYTTEKAAAELNPVTSAGGGEAPERTTSAPAAREKQSSDLLSFKQAELFLEKYGIDLGKAREEDVRSMIRWGALTTKDSDRYGRAFEENFEPVSEADLQELVRQLEAHPDVQQRIILGVDALTPEQAFQELFVEADIRHFIYRRFSEYQRVDAKTRQPLKSQKPSGKAGILFTPNHLNLPPNLRNISPNDQLAKMANGQKYVGPVGWMKLFRQSVDRALPVLYPKEAGNLDSLKLEQYKALVQKALLDRRIDEYLPDVKTYTQFPDLRHKDDGAVPYLDFYPRAGYREVVLHCDDPANPDDNLGGRDALGTFLS